MTGNNDATLRRWHEFVATQNQEILREILSDDVKFHSPFIWKPKDKQFADVVLNAVIKVFENFRYTREMFGENSCVLEFAANIGATALEGVDIIEFDEAGKISDFKIMIRPANGLQKLGEEMGKRLAAQGFAIN